MLNGNKNQDASVPLHIQTNNFIFMTTIRNYVTLVGNIGSNTQITNFENGKSVARFSLATQKTTRKMMETTQTLWSGTEYLPGETWHNS